MMYDSECIPKSMTASVVVPVPKKGDMKDSDSYRGISGVEVPGLPNRIPGLLFADDSVVLADSAENLQTSLDAITIWSGTWEMAVNASKCAIMTVSFDDPAELTLQRQTISTTDQYTYLGYIMNPKWSVAGTIKNYKLKAQKAMYADCYFLNRSEVLTELK
ncbi:RNA-directed DNA polymerase from mobile element jockey, partial [Smittium culicis]